VLSWRDVLHEGPVHAGLTPAQLRSVRAIHLETQSPWRWDGAAADFEARDRVLEEHASARYVLWFEADLYDQLQLVQVLCRLDALGVAPERVTLVSIGEYRGIAHFGGLGELPTAALARLLPEGMPLRAATYELAREAWRAFTAPTPRDVPEVARTASPELRFLGEAFARLMQEYPSRMDGLSLTERRTLMVVDDRPETVLHVFRDVNARELRPFLGDVTFFTIVRRLAVAPHPLLVVNGDPGQDLGGKSVRLTEVGREVLAGLADNLQLNGIDRWIGGVHLAGTEPGWRYDERLETLAETEPRSDDM
jgi:hypothetical protein